jgi:hypothetical protein
MDAKSVEALREKTAQLKAEADTLAARIIHPATKEHLMRPIRHALVDVETFLLPRAAEETNGTMWETAAAFQIKNAEAQLNFAKEMVANYGTSLELFPPAKR